MNVQAFVKYKVILKDSDPSTPQGKTALRDRLISFLGISQSRVDELLNSLPVTLKSGVNEEEAKAFAKVLRELGALVFIEKMLEAPEIYEKRKWPSTAIKKNRKSLLQHPYVLAAVGLIIGAMIFPSLFQSSTQPGIVIDADSLARMLKSQESITSNNNKKETKEKISEKISFFGKSYQRPVAITADVEEKDGKIKSAVIKFATESPGELTPEQIIRGMQLPWLQEGTARFSSDPNQQDKKKSKDIVKSEAKLYILRGESNERLVANATLKAIPARNKFERRYIFKLRYKPKVQFKSDPFFMEFKEEDGYSIVLNQEITVVKKDEKTISPLDKLSEKEEPSSKSSNEKEKVEVEMKVEKNE